MDAVVLGYPECDLTLYTLSLIRSSITFWEREEIKKEIRNYFSNNEEASWSPNTWHKITQKVLNLVDSSDLLVPTVVPDFKDAVLNAGVKIFDWIWYLLSELRLNISHAEQICWTPLGFIDEAKIFKTVWENNQSLCKGDKKIFRLASLFTQEKFIQTHQDDILKRMKKLHVKANIKESDDKVYGIISICLSRYINHYLFKERKRNYFYHMSQKTSPLLVKVTQKMNNRLIQKFDHQEILRNILNDSVQKGKVAPPHIMVKLCVFVGLTHGTRYYYKKLDDSQKGNLNAWIKSYCRKKIVLINPSHYTAGKLREISAFIDHNDIYTTPSHLLLYLCPFESAVWPKFIAWINGEDCNLHNFFQDFVFIMKNDYDSGLPSKRNLFQKLLKKIWIKASNEKNEKTKETLIFSFINLSVYICDFTTLRSFIDTYESNSINLQYYLRLICWRMEGESYNIWDLQKKFYNEMFKSTEDRVLFFTEQFCKTGFLIRSEFETWEKLYLFLNMLNTPLRDSIDPLKCLRYLAERGNIEPCDKFIKFWHQSKEDQINLKNNFKESSYLTECFYKLWVGELFSQFSITSVSASTSLLEWMFESKEDVVEFKAKRVSILGLLDASFHNADQEFLEFLLPGRENNFYRVIGEFIDFCGTTPEIIANVKEEIRNKIEEIMSDNSDRRNYKTFHFLMDWIDLEDKSKLIEKYMPFR